jgi:hypothetical protein
MHYALANSSPHDYSSQTDIGHGDLEALTGYVSHNLEAHALLKLRHDTFSA